MHHRVGSALDDTTLRWPGGWVRVRPWRALSDIAALSVSADRPPTAGFVAECLEHVRARGCTHVITSALAPADASPFLDAGFLVRERLHVLAHDMGEIGRPPRSTRRARTRDRPAVLALDRLAFDESWQLDAHGLEDAIHATPIARFRVAGDDRIAAYAISGRSGTQGYLQRLAVAPDSHRLGWGRTVVIDALRWLRRHGVGRTVVNTQLDNASALALYEACGFSRLRVGLAVLGRTL
ncbi:MAG TPA: GNAT family N-acetyltransferase [Acidimicrobiia bacterium]|nr:GNAT family N-acetyltransferase [Acidimicrobiia bacterium]